jgi:hypothetical protein
MSAPSRWIVAHVAQHPFTVAGISHHLPAELPDRLERRWSRLFAPAAIPACLRLRFRSLALYPNAPTSLACGQGKAPLLPANDLDGPAVLHP